MTFFVSSSDTTLNSMKASWGGGGGGKKKQMSIVCFVGTLIEERLSLHAELKYQKPQTMNT